MLQAVFVPISLGSEGNATTLSWTERNNKTKTMKEARP